MAWKLPDPDAFGNYWLDVGPRKLKGPAIFPSKRVYGDGVVATGEFIAFTGSTFLFVGEMLRTFKDPKAALAAINERGPTR